METLWWKKRDSLKFNTQPVHVYVLDPADDSSPAALILTTNDGPGNPAKYRESLQFRYLVDSEETMLLALVPREYRPVDPGKMDLILEEMLMGQAYGLDEDSHVFCICRINPFFGEYDRGPIKVYCIPGGYMLQFNPEYTFNPTEMQMDTAQDVDVVFDTVGPETVRQALKTLKPGGILVSIAGGPPSPELLALAEQSKVRLQGILVRPDSAQLVEVAKLVDSGFLKPTLATVLPLSETHRAHELSETNRTRGKIVLAVMDDPSLA